MVCTVRSGADIEFVGAFFTVLSCALPHVFSQPVHSKVKLFDRDGDDDDDEDGSEPEPAAGGDVKRYRVGADQQAIVAAQTQLEALLKPATIGPALQACFAEGGGDDAMSAALHVCFAVEWILRASPSRLSPHGPRRGVLNFIAFQDGSKALLVKMWNCLTVRQPLQCFVHSVGLTRFCAQTCWWTCRMATLSKTYTKDC